MPGDYSQLKAIQDDLANAASSAGQMAGDAIADGQHAGALAAAMAVPGPGLTQFLKGQSGQQSQSHRIAAAANHAVHSFVDAALVKIMRGR